MANRSLCMITGTGITIQSTIIGMVSAQMEVKDTEKAKASPRERVKEVPRGRVRAHPPVEIPHQEIAKTREALRELLRAPRPLSPLDPHRGARVPGRGCTGIHGSQTTPMHPLPPVIRPAQHLNFPLGMSKLGSVLIITQVPTIRHL